MSAEASVDIEEETFCRVCRSGSEVGPLFSPCKCSGSIGHIHEPCLKQWLEHSQNKPECEICGHPFSFQNVYKEDAPLNLSVWEVAAGGSVWVMRHVARALRFALVVSLWTLIVPLSVSFIWHYYWLPYQDPQRKWSFFVSAEHSLFWDMVFGQALVLSMAALVTGLLAFYDYFVLMAAQDAANPEPINRRVTLVSLKELLSKTTERESAVEESHGPEGAILQPDEDGLGSGVGSGSIVTGAPSRSGVASSPAQGVEESSSDDDMPGLLADALPGGAVALAAAHPPQPQAVPGPYPVGPEMDQHPPHANADPHGPPELVPLPVPLPDDDNEPGNVDHHHGGPPPLPPPVPPVGIVPDVGEQEIQGPPDLLHLLGFRGPLLPVLPYVCLALMASMVLLFAFTRLPFILGHYARNLLSILEFMSPTPPETPDVPYLDRLFTVVIGHLCILFLLIIAMDWSPLLERLLQRSQAGRLLLPLYRLATQFILFYLTFVKVAIAVTWAIVGHMWFSGWFILYFTNTQLTYVPDYGLVFSWGWETAWPIHSVVHSLAGCAADGDNYFSWLSWLASMLLVGFAFHIAMSTTLTAMKKEVNPWVIWFYREHDDPNFHPFEDMVKWSTPTLIVRYFRSFLMTCAILLVGVVIPIRLCTHFYSPSSQHPSYLFSLLFLLRGIQPYIISHVQPIHLIKVITRVFFKLAGRLVGLESYCVGDQPVLETRRIAGAAGAGIAPGGAQHNNGNGNNNVAGGENPAHPGPDAGPAIVAAPGPGAGPAAGQVPVPPIEAAHARARNRMNAFNLVGQDVGNVRQEVMDAVARMDDDPNQVVVVYDFAAPHDQSPSSAAGSDMPVPAPELFGQTHETYVNPSMHWVTEEGLLIPPPYMIKPKRFKLRVLGLVILFCVVSVIVVTTAMYFPMFVGRTSMRMGVRWSWNMAIADVDDLDEETANTLLHVMSIMNFSASAQARPERLPLGRLSVSGVDEKPRIISVMEGTPNFAPRVNLSDFESSTVLPAMLATPIAACGPLPTDTSRIDTSSIPSPMHPSPVADGDQASDAAHEVTVDTREHAVTMHGSVCVAERGNCTFTEKVEHCSSAGARMAMIVNTPKSSMFLFRPKDNDGPLAPISAILVSHQDGTPIIEALQAGQPVSMDFSSFHELDLDANTEGRGDDSIVQEEEGALVPADSPEQDQDQDKDSEMDKHGNHQLVHDINPDLIADLFFSNIGFHVLGTLSLILITRLVILAATIQTCRGVVGVSRDLLKTVAKLKARFFQSKLTISQPTTQTDLAANGVLDDNKDGAGQADHDHLGAGSNAGVVSADEDVSEGAGLSAAHPAPARLRAFPALADSISALLRLVWHNRVPIVSTVFAALIGLPMLLVVFPLVLGRVAVHLGWSLQFAERLMPGSGPGLSQCVDHSWVVTIILGFGLQMVLFYLHVCLSEAGTFRASFKELLSVVLFPYRQHWPTGGVHRHPVVRRILIPAVLTLLIHSIWHIICYGLFPILPISTLGWQMEFYLYGHWLFLFIASLPPVVTLMKDGFAWLHERVRAEKYLLRQQLQNYETGSGSTSSAATQGSTE